MKNECVHYFYCLQGTKHRPVIDAGLGSMETLTRGNMKVQEPQKRKHKNAGFVETATAFESAFKFGSVLLLQWSYNFQSF